MTVQQEPVHRSRREEMHLAREGQGSQRDSSTVELMHIKLYLTIEEHPTQQRKPGRSPGTTAVPTSTLLVNMGRPREVRLLEQMSSSTDTSSEYAQISLSVVLRVIAREVGEVVPVHTNQPHSTTECGNNSNTIHAMKDYGIYALDPYESNSQSRRPSALLKTPTGHGHGDSLGPIWIHYGTLSKRLGVWKDGVFEWSQDDQSPRHHSLSNLTGEVQRFPGQRDPQLVIRLKLRAVTARSTNPFASPASVEKIDHRARSYPDLRHHRLNESPLSRRDIHASNAGSTARPSSPQSPTRRKGPSTRDISMSRTDNAAADHPKTLSRTEDTSQKLAAQAKQSRESFQEHRHHPSHASSSTFCRSRSPSMVEFLEIDLEQEQAKGSEPAERGESKERPDGVDLSKSEGGPSSIDARAAYRREQMYKPYTVSKRRVSAKRRKGSSHEQRTRTRTSSSGEESDPADETCETAPAEGDGSASIILNHKPTQEAIDMARSQIKLEQTGDTQDAMNLRDERETSASALDRQAILKIMNALQTAQQPSEPEQGSSKMPLGATEEKAQKPSHKKRAYRKAQNASAPTGNQIVAMDFEAGSHEFAMTWCPVEHRLSWQPQPVPAYRRPKRSHRTDASRCSSQDISQAFDLAESLQLGGQTEMTLPAADEGTCSTVPQVRSCATYKARKARKTTKLITAKPDMPMGPPTEHRQISGVSVNSDQCSSSMRAAGLALLQARQVSQVPEINSSGRAVSIAAQHAQQGPSMLRKTGELAQNATSSCQDPRGVKDHKEPDRRRRSASTVTEESIGSHETPRSADTPASSNSLSNWIENASPDALFRHLAVHLPSDAPDFEAFAASFGDGCDFTAELGNLEPHPASEFNPFALDLPCSLQDPSSVPDLVTSNSHISASSMLPSREDILLPAHHNLMSGVQDNALTFGNYLADNPGDQEVQLQNYTEAQLKDWLAGHDFDFTHDFPQAKDNSHSSGESAIRPVAHCMDIGTSSGVADESPGDWGLGV